MRVYCNTVFKGCFTVDAPLVESCINGIEIVHRGKTYSYPQQYIESLRREFDVVLNKSVYRIKKKK